MRVEVEKIFYGVTSLETFESSSEKEVLKFLVNIENLKMQWAFNELNLGEYKVSKIIKNVNSVYSSSLGGSSIKNRIVNAKLSRLLSNYILKIRIYGT